jgi:hypothetical protein
VNPVAADPVQLEQAYEALRAQAMGQLPASTPRGLALFLARGLPSWLVAWTTPTLAPAASVRPAPAASTPKPGFGGLSAELVMVLTEMVLGGQRRYAT